MNGRSSPRAAATAVTLVVVTTAAWWTLALWPAGDGAPSWLLRTRDVCFGVRDDGLPDAGGWLLLVGQPLGMLGLAVAIWGAELRDGARRTLSHAGGQVMAGAALALAAAVIIPVALRLRSGGSALEAFDPRGPTFQLTRIDDAAPTLTLIDQSGHEVALEAFRGRPVLVTFAYAHCQTVCPQIVSDVMRARSHFDRDPPVVLIVTLDPWRDTPERLPSIAKLWALEGGAHVLSGSPETVDRTLSAWRVPRTRNLKTGDVTHPSMVYVIGPKGRIAYVITGNAETISAAVRAL